MRAATLKGAQSVLDQYLGTKSKRTKELELANESFGSKPAHHSEFTAAARALCKHESIRTPLNCTGSLLQQAQLTPMLEESVRMIVTSGDLLLSVVNDVLDYSKPKSSLQNTLSSVLHSIEMKATLRAEYDILLPEYIHMDSRRLQQVRSFTLCWFADAFA